jgi:hypothetical protein
LPRKAKKRFDPKIFLATVNHGRRVPTYPRDAVVFQQAGPAEAVFYVLRGRVKIVVTSHLGRSGRLRCLPPASSSARVA